jgi:outer membrane protein assembly factor BamA
MKKNKNSPQATRIFWAVCLLPFFFATFSCVPTYYLSDNQRFLYNQKIEGNRNIPTEDLEGFYRQKTNRRILYLPIMPYLYAYVIGEQAYREKDSVEFTQKLELLKKEYEQKMLAQAGDLEKAQKKRQKIKKKYSKKIERAERYTREGNWLMRTVGEKPVIYDSLLAQQTADQLHLALKQRGYFHNQVQIKVQNSKFNDKLAQVTYQIQEGEPYRIRQIRYQIADTTMRKLVLADTLNCRFRVGRHYNESHLSAERDRLHAFMLDNGYFDFSKQYIHFNIDTLIQTPLRLDIEVVITNPTGKEAHRVYYVDSVQVWIDVTNLRRRNLAKQTEYEGITYYEYDKKYSKKVLDSKILVKSQAPFNQSQENSTLRSLSFLNMFSVINIRHDTLGSKFVTNIYVNPLKKYNISLEGGVGVNVNQILPGPFFSASFQNRNLFRGCEILEISARGAIEYQSALNTAGTNTNFSQALRTEQFNLNFSLLFPQFVAPFLTRNYKKRLSQFNPRTRLQTGAAYTNRPEYERVRLDFSWDYNWYNNKFTTYQIDFFDLNFINTSRLDSLFRQNLEELAARGNNLLLSFGKSAISSLGGQYTYNTNLQDMSGRRAQTAHYWQQRIEIGTTFLNIIQRNLGGIGGVLLGDSIQSFQFMRLDNDFRYYKSLSRSTKLALRLHAGAAFPFGSVGVLPYERYFFAGGGNSLRAWQQRRLGPGSYTPPLLEDGSFDYRFEQPGELIWESSIELRQKLFGFVEGAVFVDAGNVWMLTQDSRRGSEFNVNRFWKEFAVGTGFGMRFDFTFLIIRADVGIKVIDPALPEGNRFVGDRLWRYPLRESSLNVAIGYPF